MATSTPHRPTDTGGKYDFVLATAQKQRETRTRRAASGTVSLPLLGAGLAAPSSLPACEARPLRPTSRGVAAALWLSRRSAPQCRDTGHRGTRTRHTWGPPVLTP